MKLFTQSQGFILAFGFDMVARKPSPRRISWCDPGTGEWDIKPTSMAGYVDMPFTVAPEFVREHSSRIIVYQPGKCIEMDYVGPPFVWSIRTLQADQESIAEAA